MLVCENLEVCFNDEILFEKLGVSLQAGSLLYLSGRNGSGKTTLLKIIAGLNLPTAGKISWNNINILDDYHNYCNNLNYIGHKNALDASLPVIDNLSFWSKMHGSEELLLAAMNYFGLLKLADMPIAELSAGWQRRVSLAKLICCYAKIWLLDEPETNLDVEAKNILENLIKIRTEQGGIVIIATHQQPPKEAMTLNMEDFIR
jgi:heme exporter protein A